MDPRARTHAPFPASQHDGRFLQSKKIRECLPLPHHQQGSQGATSQNWTRHEWRLCCYFSWDFADLSVSYFFFLAFHNYLVTASSSLSWILPRSCRSYGPFCHHCALCRPLCCRFVCKAQNGVLSLIVPSASLYPRLSSGVSFYPLCSSR